MTKEEFHEKAKLIFDSAEVKFGDHSYLVTLAVYDDSKQAILNKATGKAIDILQKDLALSTIRTISNLLEEKEEEVKNDNAQCNSGC